MPVIGIPVARLHELLRANIKPEEVEVLLDQIGCDLEGVVNVRRYQSKHSDYMIEVTPAESLPLTDPHSGVSGATPEEVWEPAGEETVVRLDLLPVRPDIFDAGGLARALRGYMGVETGFRDYAALAPQFEVQVDEEITDPAFRRPLIQCAVIRNLRVDEDLLRAIMRLQENLHWALCRDRKFASIGAYDLDTLVSPVRYTLVERAGFRFTPLFWGHREPVSPELMLTEHPKGMAYAHLVEGLERLPALLSANGNVLSLPPIINAEETKITTATRNIFLDVTGSNARVVEKALAILATSLVEMDPAGEAQLERVSMVFPEQTVATPQLAADEFAVDPTYAANWLGLGLTRSDCAALLEKMRHSVTDAALGPDFDDNPPLKVKVPAYRCDIMHEVDLVEDIAIAYGYHNIQPRLVPTFTAGKPLPIHIRGRQAAEVMAGLGFTEVLSLVLTNERDHYEKLNLEPPERRVTLANPASPDQTMLREHLLSSLMEQLALNTDHPLPQRIFEVGPVATYAGQPPDAERPQELIQVAGAVCATRAGYALGRSLLDALLRELGYEAPQYAAAKNPAALPGRAASVSALVDGTRQEVAQVFEAHPQVLGNWRIGNPVVLFSLTLGPMEYH